MAVHNKSMKKGGTGVLSSPVKREAFGCRKPMKFLRVFFLVLIFMVFVETVFGFEALATGKSAKDFGGNTVLIVHYHRYDGTIMVGIFGYGLINRKVLRGRAISSQVKMILEYCLLLFSRTDTRN